MADYLARAATDREELSGKKPSKEETWKGLERIEYLSPSIEPSKRDVMTVKKLNLPMPPELHEALFAESRSLGVPATRIVRSALEDWLAKRRRARLEEEIHRFATTYGGTEVDLDPQLEQAATEELLRLDDDEAW